MGALSPDYYYHSSLHGRFPSVPPPLLSFPPPPPLFLWAVGGRRAASLPAETRSETGEGEGAPASARNESSPPFTCKAVFFIRPPPPSPALTSEKNTSPAPLIYNCDVKDEKGAGEGSTFSSAKKMPGGQIFEHPDRYRPVCAPRPSLPFLVSEVIFGPIFLSPPSLPAPNRRLSQTIPPLPLFICHPPPPLENRECAFAPSSPRSLFSGYIHYCKRNCR